MNFHLKNASGALFPTNYIIHIINYRLGVSYIPLYLANITRKMKQTSFYFIFKEKKKYALVIFLGLSVCMSVCLCCVYWRGWRVAAATAATAAATVGELFTWALSREAITSKEGRKARFPVLLGDPHPPTHGWVQCFSIASRLPSPCTPPRTYLPYGPFSYYTCPKTLSLSLSLSLLLVSIHLA